MHPEMMIALANEVESDRQHERQTIARRSLADAGRRASSDPGRSPSALVERLVASLGLRPRLS
jgi:hypothetical protein